jgi:hypothetical protein
MYVCATQSILPSKRFVLLLLKENRKKAKYLSGRVKAENKIISSEINSDDYSTTYINFALQLKSYYI